MLAILNEMLATLSDLLAKLSYILRTLSDTLTTFSSIYRHMSMMVQVAHIRLLSTILAVLNLYK